MLKVMLKENQTDVNHNDYVFSLTKNGEILCQIPNG